MDASLLWRGNYIFDIKCKHPVFSKISTFKNNLLGIVMFVRTRSKWLYTHNPIDTRL